MALGPSVPGWLELRRHLVALTDSSGADNAYVLDAWANLWCAGHAADWTEQSSMIEIVQKTLAALRPPLQRGGRLDRALLGYAGHGYIRSFASSYVLTLRFPGPYLIAAVRQAVVEALPRIESLTIALPPPDGPGSAAGEGFGVA